MAQFLLHVHCENCIAEDPEGIDRPDVEAAKEEALRGIRSILCDELTRGKIDLRGRIDIADETGAVVATVTFEEAVQIVR